MIPRNSKFRAYALVRQILNLSDECVSTKVRVTGNHACFILVILNCLYIYIYRLKGWYMSADRPRKEKSFYRDNQIGFQFNHICIVLKQITQQIHTLQVCVNFWCPLYKRFNFRPTVTRQRVSLKRDRFPCTLM